MEPLHRGRVSQWIPGSLGLAGCDWILEMDAGFSHRPEQIPGFLACIPEGFDCAFGSRFCEAGAYRQSWKRRLMSQGGTWLSNAVLGTHLSDMTSGFELFSREALALVLEKGIHSWGPDFSNRDPGLLPRVAHPGSADRLCEPESAPGQRGYSGGAPATAPAGDSADARTIAARGETAEKRGAGGHRMSSGTALVVTSIASPNEALRRLAEVGLDPSWRFYLIGDERSPRDFHLRGCESHFLEAERHRLRFAKNVPSGITRARISATYWPIGRARK